MILTPLQDITAYRMHVPKWAVAPTSGAGAARAGGRANRIGTSALYLALEVATAVAEYQQLSPLLPPGTLVSYRVTATPVVDFTSGFRADLWPPLWESFFCDWRRDWFNARIEPPSWVLGDEAIAAGAKGILFRSTQAAGGTNLVLFVDQLGEGDRLDVNDPAGALPRNQVSWGEPTA
ncbi:RES family NAD+ phosphorylase [Burkholderia gladioli]|uniref:RES family NAD+ phosphorylase n=1 Tax=Burkholderia gladioli TaxID=28095 RepID=UPI000F5261FB|nr:RES family NAD+ phosphorylase [Burkholderia gladioli]MBU9193005.1 RES family NAD+ phosphorylase [Burkholderia gladioli]